MGEQNKTVVCDVCGGSDLRVQVWINVNTGAQANTWPDGAPYDNSVECVSCEMEVEAVPAVKWTGPKEECHICGSYFLKTEMKDNECPECHNLRVNVVGYRSAEDFRAHKYEVINENCLAWDSVENSKKYLGTYAIVRINDGENVTLLYRDGTVISSEEAGCENQDD